MGRPPACCCTKIFHYGIIENIDSTPEITVMQNACPTPQHEGPFPMSHACIFRPLPETNEYPVYATTRSGSYNGTLETDYTRKERLNSTTLARNIDIVETTKVNTHAVQFFENTNQYFVLIRNGNGTANTIKSYNKSDSSEHRTYTFNPSGTETLPMGYAASDEYIYVLFRLTTNSLIFIYKINISTGIRVLALTVSSATTNFVTPINNLSLNCLAWCNDRLVVATTADARDINNISLSTYNGVTPGIWNLSYMGVLFALDEDFNFVHGYPDINPIIHNLTTGDSTLIYRRQVSLVAAGKYVILNRTETSVTSPYYPVSDIYTGNTKFNETWVQAIDVNTAEVCRLKQNNVSLISGTIYNHGVVYAADYSNTRNKLVVAVNGYRLNNLPYTDASRVAEYSVSGSEQTPNWMIDPNETPRINISYNKYFTKCFYDGDKVVFSKQFYTK